MSVSIPLVCSVVAVAAAVRSTWSPCGLSMLSTITPISERAKGHSYLATSAWFAAGATLGGASLGLVMAPMALAVRQLHPAVTVIGGVALASSLVAMVSDSGVAGVRIPFHRRQLNERWLDQFRPSVYGLGFGWQIGTGLATYITTAAVYLMIVLGVLTGRPLVALTVGTCFGALRGSAVLLTRQVTDPTGLRAFHQRFFHAGPGVRRVVLGVEFGAATLIAWLLGTPAVVVVAVVLAATALIRITRPARHAIDAPACSVPDAGGPAYEALTSVGGSQKTG